jgi:serine O-acetyltransferase
MSTHHQEDGNALTHAPWQLDRINAGATILGRITIGRGSTIGGNVWITRDVPPDSRVAQALSRSDAFDDGGGI